MNSKLKHIMAKTFSFDITNTSDSEAFEFLKESNSLIMMTFIAAVEDAFDISFSDEEIIELLDIESIERILSNNLTNITEEA